MQGTQVRPLVREVDPTGHIPAEGWETPHTQPRVEGAKLIN